MAQYPVPSGADPIDFLLRENANLKSRVVALEGRRLSTWDRYDHAAVAAPVEGQHVIEASDESVWRYSNGEWRQFSTGARRVSSVAYDFPIDRLTLVWSFNEILQSGYSVVTDATYPLGAYFQASLDAKYFVLGFPLGPKGSRWAVNLNFGTGPDHGKIQLQWAQTAATVLAADSESGVDTPEYLYGPGTIGTWYQTNNSDLIDLYSAGVVKDVSVREQSLFTINGDDGAQLSADGTSDPFPSSVYMNGSGDGSYWWWLRVLTSGKNASSTGFKTSINRIRVTRITQGGEQVI